MMVLARYYLLSPLEDVLHNLQYFIFSLLHHLPPISVIRHYHLLGNLQAESAAANSRPSLFRSAAL